MAWKIDNATSAAAPPTVPVAGAPGYFTNGNPGGGIEATDVDDWWLNMVQGEISAIALAAGLTLDKTNNAQAIAAIQLLIGNATRIKFGGSPILYVSAAGSDANNGLTALTPFATLQHAYTVLNQNFDQRGQTAVIQLADGAYTAGLGVDGSQGSTGPIVVQGNMTTPANVTVTLAAGSCFAVQNNGFLTVQGVKMSATGSNGNALNVSSCGVINYNTVEFGVCAGAHCNATGNGVIVATGNYKISGAAAGHWAAGVGQIEAVAGITITLTGTPAFSSPFAVATGSGGYVYCPSITFSGDATGTRYSAILNGVINTGGGGATFIPGSVSGTTATGGQYA